MRLRVAVHGRRLDIRGILEQAFEDVDRLPHAAWDEVAEQGDVGIGDVVVYLAVVKWASSTYLMNSL